MILSPAVEHALLVLREQHEHIFYVGLEFPRREYHVLFRPLTLAETNILSMAGPSMPPIDLNEWITSKCLLYIDEDVNLEEGPAALPDLIADSIIRVSGFEDPNNYKQLLDECRAQTATLQGHLEAFICAAFPGTKPREIANMTIYKQMELLARAEVILGRTLDLTPVSEVKSKSGRRLSPEAAAICAPEAADRPNIRKEIEEMREVL